MSIIASLANARSGMSATGVRAQVTSANIANVSTTGYVRREVVLSQSGQTGVTVTGVSRVQDKILLQSRRDAQAQSAGSEVIDASLKRALSAFGEPGSQTGIFGRLTQFETDLQTLRSTPESAAAQNVTVDSLKDLTRSLTKAAQDLQAERTQADARLATDISQVNEIAEDLYELNGHIRKAGAAGGDTAALLDQRDAMIGEISKRLPVKVDYEDSGAVTIRTATGLTLVGPTVTKIEFQPAFRIGSADTTTASGGRLSIPTLHGEPIAPGSGPHGVGEGRIAAWLELRDDQLPTQADALDTFAFDLASAFDAIGEPLLLDTGAPVLAANKKGLAERLGVNALIDPLRGGEPRRLRDGLASVAPGAPGNDVGLSRLTETLAPFAGQLGTLISDVSTVAFRASRIHAGNLARVTTLDEAHNQLTGVDLDYELQNLLAIEQAYTANAKIIQAVSDMFDTLARI
ncbi:flagellar hook-associated protein FlgK [uncultured Algimonas sp.]|uniref:flagellar hook-associated protein FlgK n=1 Tax=uncultured Algimonas sp. TaxID=1547920 RepID=UPI00260BDB7B|nr:flagellar hook-associated protein FlgK [uncultured Algimonas sp.]